ncbi:MAG TPA: hypothetical protein VJR06_09555, partial [Nitrososphaerales archaeon]|nr:hypothetical protein [Nitrososphaerales archaeon]
MSETKPSIDQLTMDRVKYLLKQVEETVPALKELAGLTDEARQGVEKEIAEFALSIKTTRLDKDALEPFFKKPYYLMAAPGRRDSWYLVVPKFVD